MPNDTSAKPPPGFAAIVDLQIADDVPANHPTTEDLTRWADLVAQHQQRTLEISVRLVGRLESQALNHQYRGKDAPTNVLSFPFEAPPGITWNEPFLGDLALCSDVIIDEAKAQHKMPDHHWAHITIHGILHLLGYDHIDDADADVMEALECQLLSQLDIPDPYRLSGEHNRS